MKGKSKKGKYFWQDINYSSFKHTLREDFKDIYHFYLDRETKERLSSMHRIKRFLFISWWILKSLFFKLAPVRRILFIVSIFLVLQQTQFTLGETYFSLNLQPVAFFFLLLILLLELKDKMFATDELAVGRAVQTALMPGKSPEIRGWDIWFFSRPANDVGGDMIDFLEIGEEKWGIGLADTAGKGLGAALISSKLQATLRALVPLTEPLDNLAKKVNQIFCRDSLASRFVSLVYMIIEEGSDNIRFVNAGHLPPLIIKNGKLIEMEKGNCALGLMDDAEYLEKEICLARNDWLVVYTDGITEARNEDGKFFGEEKLFRFLELKSDLSAAETGRLLISEVDDFMSKGRYNDDVSLVLLKKKG